jgi:hypothetical protein
MNSRRESDDIAPCDVTTERSVGKGTRGQFIDDRTHLRYGGGHGRTARSRLTDDVAEGLVSLLKA